MNPDIRLYFSESVVPDTNIQKIILKPSLKHIINGAHMNYEYEYETYENKYLFQGFYFHDYLILLIDRYHKELDVSVELKQVYFIPIEWKMVENNHTSYFILNEPDEKVESIFCIYCRNRIQSLSYLHKTLFDLEKKYFRVRIKNYYHLSKNNISTTHYIWKNVKDFFSFQFPSIEDETKE
jgi:hypothetical protein